MRHASTKSLERWRRHSVQRLVLETLIPWSRLSVLHTKWGAWINEAQTRCEIQFTAVEKTLKALRGVHGIAAQSCSFEVRLYQRCTRLIMGGLILLTYR